MVRLTPNDFPEIRLPSARLRSGLIVDDVKSMRFIVDKTMRGMGMTTLHAENGTAAFSIVQNNLIDIVVTDVEMPAGSGLDLLIRMRRSKVPSVRQLPVIVTSSLRDRLIERQVRRIQFAYFLPKPIPVLELRVMLQMIATSRWLRTRAPSFGYPARVS